MFHYFSDIVEIYLFFLIWNVYKKIENILVLGNVLEKHYLCAIYKHFVSLQAMHNM